MASNKQRLIGWVLSGLLAVMLIGPSAMGKFLHWEGKDQMLEKMGIEAHLLCKIGVVEVVIALLFVIPRTSFIAAILLSAYLGGAVMTHLRIGEPIYMPIVIGVLVWVALGLREPRVFRLAFGWFAAPPGDRLSGSGPARRPE